MMPARTVTGASPARLVVRVMAYRGGEGQWAWLLHRVTGLGIALFLIVHVLDIGLVAIGPDAFGRFLALYRHPVAKVLEIGLLFGVLFHAVNGGRVLLVDLWPSMARHQRRLVHVEMALLAATLLPAIWVTLRILF